MWGARLQVGVTRPRRGRNGPGRPSRKQVPAIWNRPARCELWGRLGAEERIRRRLSSDPHGLSLSITRGRGDVMTRFILLLSADAYAMQLCKQA